MKAASDGAVRRPAPRSAEIMRLVAAMTRPGVSQYVIADRAGVAQPQVSAAQAVLAQDPALATQVLAGRIGLESAYKAVVATRPPRAVPLAEAAGMLGALLEQWAAEGRREFRPRDLDGLRREAGVSSAWMYRRLMDAVTDGRVTRMRAGWYRLTASQEVSGEPAPAAASGLGRPLPPVPVIFRSPAEGPLPPAPPAPPAAVPARDATSPAGISATAITRTRSSARRGGVGVVDPRFWTVAEVAGVMRVSKVTVYRLIHGGELEAIRVGRPFRVPERAVFRYLAGNGASVTVSPGQFVTASPSDQQTGRQP